MNSKERMMATLAGQQTDRRVVAPLLSLYGAKLTDCPLHTYYHDPEAYADGQSAVYETFRPDFLFSPSAMVIMGEAFGASVKYHDDSLPALAGFGFEKVSDMAGRQLPDVDSHPRLTYVREAVRTIHSRHGEHALVAGLMLSPLDLPSLLFGIEQWLETLLFDEAGCRQVLDVTVPFCLDWARAFLSDGADFVIMTNVFSNPEVVSEKVASELILPVLNEVFSQLQAPVILHHGGARMLPFLECFSDLPNVAGFVLDSRDPIHEAREKAGPSKVLLWGPSGTTLDRLRPSTVKARVLAQLEDCRQDKHLVLGTSATDVPLNTPPENIHAIFEAAKEAG